MSEMPFKIVTVENCPEDAVILVDYPGYQQARGDGDMAEAMRHVGVITGLAPAKEGEGK